MSGVTRTVVPSGRSTGSNNSILPARTTARTVLSMAHASSASDNWSLSALLCRKVRCSAVLCLALVCVLLGERCLPGKGVCGFLRPLGAERQASPAAEAGATQERSNCLVCQGALDVRR